MLLQTYPLPLTFWWPIDVYAYMQLVYQLGNMSQAKQTPDLAGTKLYKFAHGGCTILCRESCTD